MEHVKTVVVTVEYTTDKQPLGASIFYSHGGVVKVVIPISSPLSGDPLTEAIRVVRDAYPGSTIVKAKIYPKVVLLAR